MPIAMPAAEQFSRLPAGNHRLPCPACSKRPTDKTLGVSVAHDGAAVWHCFRCGAAGASQIAISRRYGAASRFAAIQVRCSVIDSRVAAFVTSATIAGPV
jgi:hypothetical protein